jgi:hypothetical protein
MSGRFNRREDNPWRLFRGSPLPSPKQAAGIDSLLTTPYTSGYMAQVLSHLRRS